jgi:hypothetical protein
MAWLSSRLEAQQPQKERPQDFGGLKEGEIVQYLMCSKILIKGLYNYGRLRPDLAHEKLSKGKPRHEFQGREDI